MFLNYNFYRTKLIDHYFCLHFMIMTIYMTKEMWKGESYILFNFFHPTSTLAVLSVRHLEPWPPGTCPLAPLAPLAPWAPWPPGPLAPGPLATH